METGENILKQESEVSSEIPQETQGVSQEDKEAIEKELVALSEKIKSKIIELDREIEKKNALVSENFDYGMNDLFSQVEKIKNGKLNYEEVRHYSNFSAPKNLEDFIIQVEDRVTRMRELEKDLNDKIGEIGKLQKEYNDGRDKAQETGLEKDKIFERGLSFRIGETYDSYFKSRDRMTLTKGSSERHLVDLKTIALKDSMK